MAFFYVFQGETYHIERQGHYVWSPQLNNRGGKNAGYTMMTNIRKGDYIFHNANGRIMAISVAQTDCYAAPQPQELTEAKTTVSWRSEGYRVDADYYDLDSPLQINSYREWLEQHYIEGSAFTIMGKGKQQYMCRIANEHAWFFLSEAIMIQHTERIKMFIHNALNALEKESDQKIFHENSEVPKLAGKPYSFIDEVARSKVDDLPQITAVWNEENCGQEEHGMAELTKEDCSEKKPLRSFFDAVNELEDIPRLILKFRLIGGMTLAETGAQVGGIPATMVWHQQQNALADVFKTEELFIEDKKYAYLYQSYNLDRQTFCLITREPEKVYRYLDCRYQRGTKSILELKADPNLASKAAIYYDRYESANPNNRNRKKAEAGNGISVAKMISEPSAASIAAMSGVLLDKKGVMRLQKKIQNGFDKKFYIGDIAITDSEYSALIAFLKNMVKRIRQYGFAAKDSPLLAVALVQIGIRKYSSNRYWPYVSSELGETLNITDQQRLGISFISTLKAHGKYIVSESERVSAILFHTFVSDYYAPGLFELLFQYFNNDLERDINRNTKEQMKLLMDALATKAAADEDESDSYTNLFLGQGSRAYKLKQHTLQAISAQSGHSTMRLRRFIRLIDKAFWKDSVPKNPVSRLTILFKQWVQDSSSFHTEYRRYKIGEIRNRGKKHFSTPYLYADISSSSFTVKLPAQIVPEAYADNLMWHVSIGEAEYSLPTSTYPVLTGYKTEEIEKSITTKQLFADIRCELICDDVIVRRFGDLSRSNIRLFDMEGDYAPRLFHIPMCAYTPEGVQLTSPALQDTIQTRGMIRWDFEFETGDVLILPDGNSMVVGKHFTDGFSPRGFVTGASVNIQNVEYTVYNRAPDLILTIPESKMNGTVLRINGTKYRLSDCDCKVFRHADSRGTHATYLNVEQFKEVVDRGVNKIEVDTPGHSYVKEYTFALVDGLSISFDGAPYVFAERGAMIFPNQISAHCRNASAMPLRGENGFQFEITPDLQTISVEIDGCLTVDFDVPVFMWSVDAEHWQISRMQDIWHTDFLQSGKIYVRTSGYSAALKIDNDEDVDNDDEDELHIVYADKLRNQSGYQTIDLTRFRTWITRNQIRHAIYLVFARKEYLFANVFAKSYVVSCEVNADYEAGMLQCKCDIIGKAQYYIDIVHTESERLVISKGAIIDGYFEIKDPLENGKYCVTLYEAEEDDSGFEELDYYTIHQFETRLINKYDYTGGCLSLRGVVSIGGTRLITEFGRDYWIGNLKKTAKNEYNGSIMSAGEECSVPVRVVFQDEEDDREFALYLIDTFEDEDDLIDFEFDSFTRTLLWDEADELPDLRPSERYRRYKILFDDEYRFVGALHDTIPDLSTEKKDSRRYIGMLDTKKAESNPLGLTIEEMGLSIRTYQALCNANIRNVFALVSITKSDLQNYYHLSTSAISEIQDVLHILKRDYLNERAEY